MSESKTGIELRSGVVLPALEPALDVKQIQQVLALLQEQKTLLDDKHVAAEEEKETEDRIWRSKCCRAEGTEISRSFLSYVLTSIISLSVLVFALYQLTTEESNLTPLWVSLVSSIGSLHLPSPLQKETTKP
jgi:hypothetical protein